MFTFNHFNFNVLDLERSVRFYHDALGLEPVRTKDAADVSFRLVFLGDGHSPFQLELTGLRAGLHNRPHKGHGRSGGCRGRAWGQGGWQGGIGAGGHPRSVPQAWRDLQPRWHVKRGLQAYS